MFIARVITGWFVARDAANFSFIQMAVSLLLMIFFIAVATEAALGILNYGWEKLRLSKVYAGHHPDNRASQRILEKLGFNLVQNVFYEPTGLMHPSYVRKRSEMIDVWDRP